MTTTGKQILETIINLNWKALPDEAFSTIRTAFEMKNAELKWDSNRRKQAKTLFPPKK